MANLPVLGRVQEIETRLRLLDRNIAQLKEEPELLTFRQQLREVQDQLKATAAEQSRVRVDLNKLDLDLKSVLDHIKTVEAKLYSGASVPARELELLQQKAAEYGVTKFKLEDDLLQQMEADEALTAQSQGLQQVAAKLTREIAAKEEQLELGIGEINLEVQVLQLELDDLVPTVPVEWLERYHRIAKAHNGVGIAKIKSNSCGACHVSLSDMFLLKLKRGEDVLNFCETCGRIVYY